jgi:hypothetical protein
MKIHNIIPSLWTILYHLLTSAYIVDAYMPISFRVTRKSSHTTIHRMVVDPIMFGVSTGLNVDIAMEVGIAVASAAAGAMTQIPRIQQLERELQSTKALLTSSEADLVEKIRVLEDKLFIMDQEFEEQTVKFQRQYDQTQKEQMESFKEKLKAEMAFKLDIQIAQDRSKKLLQQADTEISRTSKQEELSQLKLQQIRLNELNSKLEQAIKDSDEELTRLRTQVARKKTFLFW